MRQILCLAALLFAAPAHAITFGESAIRPATKQAAIEAPGDALPVAVEAERLAAMSAGQATWLPGTGDTAVPARVREVSRRPDGTLAWSARVETATGPQTALIVIRDGHAFGWLPQPEGRALRLETRKGRSWLGLESDGPRPEGPDVLLPPAPDAASRALRKQQDASPAAGTPRIDVLVAYQPSLVELWGSVAAVQARIAYLEALTNQAYVDSDMDLTVRVVGTHLLEVPARLDNDEALYLITDASTEAVKQEIDRVRDLYGADLVKLMRNFDRPNQTSCGVGWLGGYRGNPFVRQYGFSVTADRGFGTDGCGEWTFSHELGHNQGAHHDTETTGGDYGAFIYSRGHRQTLDESSGFATVMAYSTGPQSRIGQFSNPRQTLCLDQPCGIEEEADNARGIAETAALVAGLLPEPAASALPELTIEDVVVTEGQSGRRPAEFVLRLSQPAPTAIGVSFATRAASATNYDFAPRSGSVQIQPGQSAVTVSVDVRGDTLVEPDEYFALDLLAATGARIVRHQGVATIATDDPLPLLSIADIRVGEGNFNPREAVFTATLSTASNAPVRFDVATGQYGGAGAAASGSDFRAMRIDGLEIPAGARSVQFTVTILGDTLEEPEESFYVTIGGVQGARIEDSIIRADIIDNDGPGHAVVPALALEDQAFVEGNAGYADRLVTARLASAATADVHFSLIAESVTALAGVDFDAAGLGDLMIPAGATSVQVPLGINGDLLDEADEILLLRLANVVGARPEAGPARITLQDDDGSSSTAPLVARDDRFVLRENAGAIALDVLGNDAVATASLAGASLLVVEQAVVGSVQVDTAGTPGTAADDRLVYTPAANRWYDDAFGYRLCDVEGRCTDGLVAVTVRPMPDVDVATPTGSGFRDYTLEGLRSLPALSVDAGGATTAVTSVQAVGVDPTPESAWDSQGQDIAVLQAVAYGGTRLLVHAQDLLGGEVDLYVGVDENGNGRPDPRETRCTSASVGSFERCEMDINVPSGQTANVWQLVHNRGTGVADVRVDTWELSKGTYFRSTDDFTVSGPGNVPVGEPFPVRVGWHLPTLRPTEAFLGLVVFEDAASGNMAWVPVRFDRTEDAMAAAQPSHDLFPLRVIPPGTSDDRLFIDLPEGVESLDVYLGSSIPLNVHLARGEPGGAGASIAPAPPRGAAQHVFNGVTDGFSLAADQLAPGRWYLTLTNASGEYARTAVSVVHLANAPALAPGSYFNPDRSGHGLFLYPAGDQLAGLWYTYLQDGSPTWYYMQGSNPGSSGQWQSSLYRSVWNGSANTLVLAGKVTATVLSDGLLFSYRLDGETGSEKLVPLGSGCPTLAGLPVDASSHWFDPAKAGTGYSVQLFPDYEFYAAFVYDARGVARFLTSEAGSFRGADATMPLEQLTGFCPLCERTGAPARADIGTLRRRLANGTLVGLELDAIYGGGVPGTWSADDAVQPLGGPGTTQGCPVP